MSEDKDKIVSDAVEKALQGDMDAINNIEDRITRSKAKAALVRAKRKQSASVDSNSSEKTESSVEEKLNFSQTVLQRIIEKFPESAENDQNKDWIQLKPENWIDIANWLKSEETLYFDSLQCNTGVDLGDGILESRYNLHSMKHFHNIEIRIKVPVNKPDITSVEQVWRIADWFEREGHDLFGMNFEGHPDMKPLLLYDGFEGHPGLKSFPFHDYEEW